MAAGEDVSVTYGADITGIVNGSKEAASAVDGFKESVGLAAEAAKGFAEAWALEQVFDKIKEFISSMGELGEATERTAAMLGTSTEQVGQLQYVAESSGGSLESMSLMMERLGYNAERAAAGSKVEEDAFSRLGVSLKDAQGNTKSLTQLLLESADAYSKHADGLSKDALSMQLFGRAGVQMTPILDKGSEAIKEMMQRAEELGVALSEKTVAGMVQTQHSIIDVETAARGFGVTIFNMVQPAVNRLLQTVVVLITNFTTWAQSSYDNGGAMKFLAEMVDVVIGAIQGVIDVIQIMGSIGLAVTDTLTKSFTALGVAIMDTISGNFSGSKAALDSIPRDVGKSWQDASTQVEKAQADMIASTKAMWAAMSGDPSHSITVANNLQGNGSLPAFGDIGNIPAKAAAAKAALDSLKETIKAVNQDFTQFFSSIMTGFDSAIGGLINGTKTWQQAVFTVLGSLWNEFVKFIEGWVVKWLAGEATMLVAHQSAAAEKVAVDVASQEDSAGLMITNALKNILMDSKQTFGGVFAFLSPLMGPAAAGPATAASATVAAAASFDVGAWELSRDQVAQVHKGEMIVPAAGGVADAMRDMLAGGGGAGGSGGSDGGVHFHGGMFFDWDNFMKRVTDHMNRNRSSRGNW